MGLASLMRVELGKQDVELGWRGIKLVWRGRWKKAGEMCSKIDPSGVEMVSSFVSISADEGVEMGFLTDFFSIACV